MDITKILDIIQREVFISCDFLSKIGMSIFVMLIAVEFIKAAIDATSGRGFHIDKILYLYLFMAVFYAFFPTLQAVLKQYAYEGCKLIYKEFGVLNMPIKISLSGLRKAFETACLTSPGMFVMSFLLLPITIQIVLFVFVFSFLIAMITVISIDVIIISAFLAFEIVIAAAPFFIPFFMSGEVSHIGKQWVNNVLMHCVQLPILAMILKLVNALNKEVAHDYLYNEVIGKLKFWQLYEVVFIPLLGLGMIWQAMNLAKMLFPPSGGFVGTAIGTPVAGAIGYTAHAVTRLLTGGKGK